MDKNYESDYHNRQFREPYRSTLAFGDWLEAEGLINRESRLRILDVGSGAGANIYHLSDRFPAATFVGVDINPLSQIRVMLSFAIRESSGAASRLAMSSIWIPLM